MSRSVHEILPKEIVDIIFSYVDNVNTFVNAVLVNKLWNQKFNILWREYCRERYLKSIQVFDDLLIEAGWKMKNFGKQTVRIGNSFVSRNR
jgi:hypothetical protein